MKYNITNELKTSVSIFKGDEGELETKVLGGTPKIKWGGGGG